MKATMQVAIPPGAQKGTLVQATSPEGMQVQVQVPDGVRSGDTITVQYPVEGLAALTVLYRDHKTPLLIVLLIMIAAFFLHGMTGPVLTLANIFTRLLHYGFILVVAAACIAYDWNEHGPTVALQYGAVSAAIAWILVVPLWPLTDALIGPVIFFVVLGLGCVFIALLSASFGPFGCLIGAACMMLAMYFGMFTAGLGRDIVGGTFVFLVIYVMVRTALGNMSQDPSRWPYVTLVQEGTPEFDEQCDFFAAACLPWEHKYNFNLTVKTLYRVDRPANVAFGSASPSTAPQNRRNLFHGTQWDFAKGIVADGFRLPERAGMFGKGVYFADCPLKSWRYCFATRQLSELIPRTTGKGGLILRCDVNLGTTRAEREAVPGLTGYNRGGWRAWFTGQQGAYDSVTGVTEEEGGALRVPEYVIYDPNQARIMYIYEVLQSSKGSSGRHGQ